MNKLPPAVVLGTGINALGIIRSLGAQGVPIINLISKKAEHYSSKSKYITKSVHNLEGENLTNSLLDLAKSLEGKAVLFCTSDLQVLTVSNTRDILEKYYRMVIPKRNVIELLMNKKLFYDFAILNNFAVPKTFFSRSKNEIEEIGEVITYPCIIKPEYHDEYWDRNIISVYGLKVLCVNNKKELLDFCNGFNIIGRTLILQEWIDGGDENVFFCLLYIDRLSRPLATFTGRKLRQYPILTGSTSLAESRWEPDIANISKKVLTTAGCLGICSLELKYSSKYNNFYITEPTVGRVDTQEAISTHSGIDIPYMYYLDAIGETLTARSGFKEGIKWVNEEFDIYSVRDYLKKGETTIFHILKSYKGKRGYALFSLKDPKPFLFFLLGLGKALWRKIQRSAPRNLKNNFNA